MEAILLLEDGTVFSGEGFGAEGTAVGEVVFNTGMTGYQEVLTDPSYKGQIVTMTYPHVGNYGINEADVESIRPRVEGFVVGELCSLPSNYRSRESLDDYLKRHSVVGIHRIDTRALTRRIREKGAMMGVLSTEGSAVGELEARLKKHPRMEGRDLVQYVTVKREERWGEGASSEWYYDAIRPLGERTFRVVAYDFGMKRNILRLLTSFGMDVTVLPASMAAEKVRAMAPDGIFLSNGPGDPEGVPYAVENVRKLIGYRPIFGICLGHQILALALKAKTYKLPFGHHGCNHPVKDCQTGGVEITTQNHNFAVDPESLRGMGLHVTHENLNDGTVEGMRHEALPIYSVQYHPEASPGPHDSVYLFRKFYDLMKRHEEKGQ